MTEPRQDFLESLRWTLRSLQLAGITRIPKLLGDVPIPVAAAPAGATPSGDAAAGKHSWTDVVRAMKEQLGGSAGSGGRPARAPASRQPASSPASSKSAPATTSAAKKDAAPPAGADPALAPSRPVDPKRKKALDELAAVVAKCTRCKELAGTRTQTVFCDGPPNADLMFIGEAPGQDEDEQGVAFVGRAGQLLTKIIAGGMKMRREDVYICNILKCRPPSNRNPQPEEAANCREYLDAQIDLVAPKAICLLGGIATRFLLDDTTPVGRMRGRWHSYRDIPVRVTYHPAYLLRNYTPDARQKVWEDVLEVVRKLQELRD